MKNNSLIFFLLAGAALAVLIPATPLWAAETFTLDSARVAAEKGDARAQYFLAQHYDNGEGVPRDDAKAFGYMRQAAEGGCVFAQNDLGVFYANGQGVKQDLTQAVQWYRKAAEAGDPLGQLSLGRAYAEGRGLATNLAEAVKWYERSAAQNQAEAMTALGDLYQYGQGDIPVDYAKAIRWFEQAAARGEVGVLNNLGFIYEHGSAGTLERNEELALKYYRLAAEKNDGWGQMNLGRMYHLGIGVKTDLVTAYQWYYLADRNHQPTAHHYLNELEGKSLLGAGKPQLTPEQIQEATRRANDFLKSLGKPVKPASSADGH